MKNISVIGLGSMGFGIAQSLIRSGYNVYGQDKNTVQQKKYQTELMKVQVDDVNAVMPDDLAQELNMQKGTKWSDAEKILMGRQAIYE